MSIKESHELMAPLLPAYEMNLLKDKERDQVEGHVRQCNECFEALYHFAPVIAALQRMKEAKTTKRPGGRARPRWQWLMTAIMALLLVMSFWIFRQSSILQKEIMRGEAQIQLLAPADDSEITPPVIFRWEEEPEAHFYKIYIFRKKEMLVPGERIDTPAYDWKAASSAGAGTYEWKVESYFSDGSRIRDSVTNKFDLKK